MDFSSRSLLAIRLVARVLSVLIAALIAPILLGHVIEANLPGSKLSPPPGLVVGGLIALSGLLLAFKWETRGALVALVGLFAALADEYLRSSRIMPPILIGALPAVLYLICGLLDRRSRMSQSEASAEEAGNDSTTGTTAPEAGSADVGRRMIWLINAPRRLFASLADQHSRADWIIPFALVVLVVILSGVTTVGVELAAYRAHLETLDHYTPEEVEHTIARSRILGPPGRVYALLLKMAVIALFLQAAARLAGSVIAYSKVLSVLAYASLVMVPAAIVRAVLVHLTGDPKAQLGLNLLVPNSEGFAFGFLANLNLFALWQWGLVCLGYAAVTGLTLRKSALRVCVLVVAIAAITAGR